MSFLIVFIRTCFINVKIVILKQYEKYLARVRTDHLFLTEEKFLHIKECAAIAYPEDEESEYSSSQTVDDYFRSLKIFGYAQTYALTGEDWYFLMFRFPTRFYINDFASKTGVCKDILRVYKEIYPIVKGKKVTMICRDKTSYPFIVLFKRLGLIKIYSDKEEMNNELYHRVHLKVL